MTLPRCGRLPCCLSETSVVLLLIFCASVGAGSVGYFPSTRPGQANYYGPTFFNEQNKQLGYGPRIDGFGPRNAAYGPQRNSYGPKNGGYGPGNDLPGYGNLPSIPSFQNPLARSGLQQQFSSYQNPFTHQETFKVKAPPKGSQQQQHQQKLPAQYPPSLPNSAAYVPSAPKSSSVSYSSTGSGSPGGPKVYRTYQASSASGGKSSSSSSSDNNKYKDGGRYNKNNAAQATDGNSASSKGGYNQKNQYSDGSRDQDSHSDRKSGGSKDNYKQSYSTSSSYHSRDPAAKPNKANIPNLFGPNNPNVFFPPKGAKTSLPAAIAKPKVPASGGSGLSTRYSGGAAGNRVDVLGFGKVLGTGPGLGKVGRVFSAGKAGNVLHQPGGVFGRSGFPNFSNDFGPGLKNVF